MTDYDSTSSYDSDESEEDSEYARYPGWKKLKWKWRWRLTDRDYTPLNREKLPEKLVRKILLKLYEVFSDYDPQRGKVLRRTLAACRLVCRQWSRIVISEQRQFIIRVRKENWASSSFSWYILQRPPVSLQGGSRRNQEGDTVWCGQNYREDLMKSHPKFLPELTQSILPGFYRCVNKDSSYPPWENEDKLVIQNTLAACCLVSREWNRIFTPVLYGGIFLGGKKPLVTRSLLHRTFQHTQPARKALVKTMTIAPAEDGSTANLLSICFSLPNLRKLILDSNKINFSALHPSFAQQLRSLSQWYTIQMEEDSDGFVNVDWGSLPRYIDFTRRIKSTSRSFWTGIPPDDILYSETYLYIGKQEASVSGFVGSSDMKQFKKHLTQTGNNLKGLYLERYETSSLPEIDLHKNPHLRLLQFNLCLDDSEIEKSGDDVIRWFNSICESVTSKSLVVEMCNPSEEVEICDEIQNTLLVLYERIETFSVYLTPRTKGKGLFSKLYEMGIVIEEYIGKRTSTARHLSFRP